MAGDVNCSKCGYYRGHPNTSDSNGKITFYYEGFVCEARITKIINHNCFEVKIIDRSKPDKDFKN